MAESRWTDKELAHIRKSLTLALSDLQADEARGAVELDDLASPRGDGAGEDPVDAGNEALAREQEMTLAFQQADLVAQVRKALGRLDEGVYGVCEHCGQPITKARLKAQPSATLCLACKQREERR